MALNGHRLEVATERAVELMLGIAAGDLDEEAVGKWLEAHVLRNGPDVE